MSKLVLLCLGLAFATLCRVSLAQSAEQPTFDPPAQASGVTAAPQPREVAPQSSNPSNTDNADDVWGNHEPPRPIAPPKIRKARKTGKRSWYGGQVLTSDAFSFALVAVGLGVGWRTSDGGYGIAALGYATYLVAPPVIHFTHGRPAMTPASLGIRLGLPALGAAIGNDVNCKTSQPSADLGLCAGPGVAFGFLAGIVAASAIDAAALSWDNPQSEAPAGASFGVAPVLSADGKRGELRAFGTF